MVQKRIFAASGVALLALAAGVLVAKALKAEPTRHSSLNPALRPGQGLAEAKMASQVKEIPGPVLAILPEGGSSVYVGTRFGLYAFRQDGAPFKRILRAGIWAGAVRTMAHSPKEPGVIYVGVGNRLFRSDPQGRRFRRILKTPNSILSLAVCPFDPSRVLVGTGQGIRLSQDRGNTWHRTPIGLSDGPIEGAAFHPLLNGWTFCLSQGDLFLSRDAGTNWQRISIRLEKPSLPPAESDGLLGESDEFVEPEERAGEPDSLKLSALAIDPKTGALYLGTPQGIFTSSDGGARFTSLASVGLASPGVKQLFPDPEQPGQLYAATPQGLFLYRADLGRWTHLRQGIPAGPAHAVAVGNGGEILWVGTDEGLFRISMPKAPVPPSPTFRGPQATPKLAVSTEPTAWLAREPAIQEVQQAAIRYAEVMPQKIGRWRTLAALRNFLPRFTIDLDRDRDRTIVSSTSGGKTTFSVGPEDESVSLDFGFTWDLGSLLWDSAQTAIDVRSRLMVQLRQDVLEEVTRIYFERKRLQLEFQANPTEDPTLQTERTLRIEELTAQIDALTGGWFSQALESQGEPPASPRKNL